MAAARLRPFDPPRLNIPTMKNNNQPDELRRRLQALDAESAQQEVLLRRVIRPNESCEFGRKHGFSSLSSVSDFQHAVPLSHYEDLRGDINRMVAGEPGVLVSEPVRRFFITSGSTTGPKYIPVTSSFIR